MSDIPVSLVMRFSNSVLEFLMLKVGVNEGEGEETCMFCTKLEADKHV